MYIIILSVILISAGIIFVVTSFEKRSVPKNDENAVFVPSGSIKELQVENSAAETNIGESSSAFIQESGLYEVTVYHDESGVSLDDKIIDGTVLRNVSREGSGIAEIGKSAITVRIDKKLFRFDYYRLDRLSGHNESVVLSLKGARSAFIMISDKTDFYNKANSEFNSFHG